MQNQAPGHMNVSHGPPPTMSDMCQLVLKVGQCHHMESEFKDMLRLPSLPGNLVAESFGAHTNACETSTEDAIYIKNLINFNIKVRDIYVTIFCTNFKE